MRQKQSKIAVVTGANRGLGLETARQLGKLGYHIVAGTRQEAQGRKTVEKLRELGVSAEAFPLDVTDAQTINALADSICREYGVLHALVNNAGIYIDSRDGGDESALNTKIETIRETLETNVYGAFLLCQKFLPLMLKNQHGRIVNVSSGMGQLSEMNGCYAAYRISKTALNAVTRIFSAEARDFPDVLVNSVCPGWVRTDMGTSAADLSVEEGADTIVWLASLPKNGPTGGFYRERKRIEW